MTTVINIFAGLYALLLAVMVIRRSRWNTTGHILASGGAVLSLAWLAALALIPGFAQ